MAGVQEEEAQEVIKGIKLPMIKKMMLPEHEQLRCDMLEVVTCAGVAHAHHEIKDMPTNPWMKLYNRLSDRSSGVFRGHVPHEGVKRLCYTKQKMFKDMMPAFAKKHDQDVEDKMQSLPSFPMAKNLNGECNETINEHEGKNLRRSKRKKLGRRP